MILKKMLILMLAGVVISVLVLCCNQRATTINTAGSTTILPIVQAAAEVYMDKHSDINISVRGGGSSIGIKSAINKTIDIGNASRKISEKEANLVEDKDTDLIETAIAKDAISIVIHKNNPINNLSMEQLKAIYSGKIENWQQIGGKDQDIIVISRDVSSGSFMVFNEVVLDSSNIKENSMRLASNNAIATTVSYTPGAIGYIGMGYVSEELKTLSIDGVYSSKESALSNEYKLNRLLYVYTYSTPRKPALEFIDFILSTEGQDIVEEQGYIRIK